MSIWVSFNAAAAMPHEFTYAVRAGNLRGNRFRPAIMPEEQMHKGQLYLQAGAEEFWLCDERGAHRSFSMRPGRWNIRVSAAGVSLTLCLAQARWHLPHGLGLSCRQRLDLAGICPSKVELNKVRAGHRDESLRDSRTEESRGECPICYECIDQTGLSGTVGGVDTAENSKVPDVIWASFYTAVGRSAVRLLEPGAGSICCGDHHRRATGSKSRCTKGNFTSRPEREEFWLCDERGQMQFFDATGRLERSRLCPRVSYGLWKSPI